MDDRQKLIMQLLGAGGMPSAVGAQQQLAAYQAGEQLSSAAANARNPAQYAAMKARGTGDISVGTSRMGQELQAQEEARKQEIAKGMLLGNIEMEQRGADIELQRRQNELERQKILDEMMLQRYGAKKEWDARNKRDWKSVLAGSLLGAGGGALAGWVGSGFNPLGAVAGATAGGISGMRRG